MTSFGPRGTKLCLRMLRPSSLPSYRPTLWSGWAQVRTSSCCWLTVFGCVLWASGSSINEEARIGRLGSIISLSLVKAIKRCINTLWACPTVFYALIIHFTVTGIQWISVLNRKLLPAEAIKNEVFFLPNHEIFMTLVLSHISTDFPVSFSPPHTLLAVFICCWFACRYSWFLFSSYWFCWSSKHTHTGCSTFLPHTFSSLRWKISFLGSWNDFNCEISVWFYVFGCFCTILRVLTQKHQFEGCCF